MTTKTILKNTFCRVELRGIDNRAHRRLANTLHITPVPWLEYRNMAVLRTIAIGCGWLYWQGEINLGFYSAKARRMLRKKMEATND